jgi:hypothetical protein
VTTPKTAPISTIILSGRPLFIGAKIVGDLLQPRLTEVR